MVFDVNRSSIRATCLIKVLGDYSTLVAGSTTNGQGYSVATLWTDGEATYLSSGESNAVATSVYLIGDDVYVEGFEIDALGASVPLLWINGEVSRADSQSANVAPTNTFVMGDSEYVVGSEMNAMGHSVAKLWVNGVAQDLTDGTSNSHANSVAVKEVLVAGVSE